MNITVLGLLVAIAVAVGPPLGMLVYVHWPLGAKRRKPLECFDHEWYVSFSRPLTYDETVLVRFAWESARKGHAQPSCGWPSMPKPFPPAPNPPPPKFDTTY